MIVFPSHSANSLLKKAILNLTFIKKILLIKNTYIKTLYFILNDQIYLTKLLQNYLSPKPINN
jgi:hypothetical protein